MKRIGLYLLASALLIVNVANASDILATQCDSCNSSQAKNAAKNRPPQVEGTYIVHVLDTISESVRKYSVDVEREYVDEYGGGYYVWMRHAYQVGLTGNEVDAKDIFYDMLAKRLTVPSAVGSATDIIGTPLIQNQVNSELQEWFEDYPVPLANLLYVLIDFAFDYFLDKDVIIIVTFQDGSTAQFEVATTSADGSSQEWEYVEGSAKDHLGQPIPESADDLEPNDTWIYPDGQNVDSVDNDAWNSFVHRVQSYGIPVYQGGSGGGGGVSCRTEAIDGGIRVVCQLL